MSIPMQNSIHNWDYITQMVSDEDYDQCICEITFFKEGSGQQFMMAVAYQNGSPIPNEGEIIVSFYSDFKDVPFDIFKNAIEAGKKMLIGK